MQTIPANNTGTVKNTGEHIRRSNRELWLAFIAIIVSTGLYFIVLVTLNGIPRASDFFGHAVGIVGFILMLMTETLYSLRKRSRSARWGRMAEWLNFHIFTGIVGPYLVLLHTSWKFNGLAGVVLLLTVIIVVSGFWGRYIYTAVPRTADGVEIEVEILEQQIASTEADLQKWMSTYLEAAQALSTKTSLGQYLRILPEVPEAGGTRSETRSGNVLAIIFSRSFVELRQWFQWRLARRKIDPAIQSQFEQLEKFVQRRQELRRQVASLATARRLLGLWHTIHIPIGMALFTAAFIHIIAAIYYATLLR